MERVKSVVRVMALAMMILVAGSCGSGGDDDNTPTVPSALVLSAQDPSLWVWEQTSIEAELTYTREESPDCAWYVDDVLGGNAELGTITQDNPAVYTAPAQPPALGQVEISAVWADDETLEGAEIIQIAVPEVQLTFPSTEIQVEESLEIGAALGERGRPEDEFEWYVNDMLGGDATVGTITQGNPAVYTAPHEVPLGGGVEIKARWSVAPNLYFDAGNLAVKFTVKHVNAATGVDDPDGGRISAPYKTISYALQRMSDTSTHGDTILVAPGVYNGAMGETFNKTIKWETTLRGADRDGCIIEVDTDLTTIFYMSTNSVFERFTVRDTGSPGTPTDHLVEIQGPATVRDLNIGHPFASSAIRVMNSGVVGLVEDCVLVNSSGPGEGRGIELAHPAQGIVRGCTVQGWDYGIMITGSGSTTHRVEDCLISSNVIGVMLFSPSSMIDLGGGAAGSEGGNTIQNNTFGIFNQSIHDTYALDNTWTQAEPSECGSEDDAPCDIYSTSTGVVIWQ